MFFEPMRGVGQCFILPWFPLHASDFFEKHSHSSSTSPVAHIVHKGGSMLWLERTKEKNIAEEFNQIF